MSWFVLAALAWWATGAAMLIHVWRKELDLGLDDLCVCVVAGLGGPLTGLIVWFALWSARAPHAPILRKYKGRQ